MNKRIEELAKECNILGEKEFANKIVGFNYGKFAELIVKECLLCCERTISDPVPESVDTFEEGGIHCMDEIKQHFGVEE